MNKIQMKHLGAIGIISGVLLLAGGCTRDEAFLTGAVAGAVIESSYDSPRYYDRPYYYYNNQYYYGGQYRNGDYYYQNHRLHGGEYHERYDGDHHDSDYHDGDHHDGDHHHD